MRFDPPLVRATLIQRYKRFLADVRLEDGSVATAHVANSGKMLGVDMPGSPVWLARGTGKLPWSLKFVETTTSWAGVDTHIPNKIVAEALAAGALPAFAAYPHVKAEVKYGVASRVDFLLTDDAGRRLWLEIKNVHLSRTPRLAEFPDCAAARSARHMGELGEMVRHGDRAAALFVIQRTDCDRFRPAADLDPGFAAAFEAARAAGVEVHAHMCDMTPEAVTLAGPVQA